MNEVRLKIENFGPIKNADIIVRKYNIFIGHTSSGKSVAAKLLAIFREFVSLEKKEMSFSVFVSLLIRYNINFEFGHDTELQYINDSMECVVSKNSLKHKLLDTYNIKVNTVSDIHYKAFDADKIVQTITTQNSKEIRSELHNLASLTGKEYSDVLIQLRKLLLDIRESAKPVYIPAERLLITMFSNSIFSLLNVGVNIPSCIKKFGSLYEKSRNDYKEDKQNASIDVMNIQVEFSNDGDFVYLDNDKKIELGQASSGIQSIVPLWIVFNYFVAERYSDFLVIEEPELNLFPSAQVRLINSIIETMKLKDGSVVLTTHSPYVLSVIDNLILANEIKSKAKKGKKKITIAKIKDLIPSMALIDFNDVSSYFFDNNGSVSDIRDEENRLVGGERIDDASNETSYVFMELSNLSFENGGM